MSWLVGAPLKRRLITALLATLLGLFVYSGIVAAQGTLPDRSTALAVLEEILERPEFQWSETQPTLLERIWTWLLRQLFNLIPTSGAGGPLAAMLLLGVGLLALLFILAYVGLRLRRQVSTGAEEVAAVELPQLKDADQALERAESVAQQGDYRLALRYLYLSTLLYLHERGLIRYDRTKTNREYLQSVSQQPQLAPVLREIVNVFDRSWYGLQTPDEQTYEQFIRHVRQLRNLK